MEILERAQALEAQGRDIVHMEVGEPDFDTPKLAVEAGVKALQAGRTHYTHSLGIEPLRRAIARSYGREHDLDISPDRVVITVGSSAALLLAFTVLLDPGDELIISDPGYACYPNIALSVGGVPVPVPVSAEAGFTYKVAEIERRVSPRTKAIVVNSPANPTGTITPAHTLEAIGELGIPVVSDEIYHGLVYEGQAQPILSIDPDAFVVSGFSKRYAMTGWRLGYLIVPPRYLRQVQALQQNLFISASDFGQWAALAALDATDEIEAMRREFDERRLFLIDALPSIGLEVPARPQGAFYMFADARRFTDDSKAFAIDLLEKAGVAVTPGIDFGSRGEGYVRLSYANSLPRLKEGIDRLGAYLASL